MTQPDKAKDRGKKIQFSPVKEAAINNSIEVLQPQKIRESNEAYERIAACDPDICVVAAYGQLIPEDMLKMPKFGFINVHASLLPRFRGASPIQHAILCGDEVTGVTIMQMAKGLDTGDMLSKVEVPVNGMNCEELSEKLASAGAELLISTLQDIEAGKVTPVCQDDSQSTYAGLISKKDGRIDFSKRPEEIERQIRAFDPWPGAFCDVKGIQMKVWKAECLNAGTEEPFGTVIKADEAGIDISCGGGILRAVEIQMPGKKRTSVDAFLRGNNIEKGTVLG